MVPVDAFKLPVAQVAVPSKAVVLLLLTFCSLLLPLWESVIVLCFVVRYFVSIVVFAILLMGKRELVALLSLSSWCLVIVVWLFLVVPSLCLHFVSMVFPDCTHFLFLQFQELFSKPCLIKLISKDTYLVFSISATIFAKNLLR